MKWERILVNAVTGLYKYTSENGWKIKKTQSRNMFTKKIMSDQVWEIFNEKGEKVGYQFTLKEAKEKAEKMMGVQK